MKETVNGKILWNEAGKAGIVLGGVVIIYSLLVSLIGMTGGFFGSILTFLLWVAKFGGCLYLMRFFMLRLTTRYDGVTNRSTFGYGVRIALLSALVCSAYDLCESLLHPDMIDQIFDVIESQYASMMDSNMMSAMDQFRQNYPAYSFFGNLIYCFLFGTVLAKIYSSTIPPKDPFQQPEQQ